MITMSVCLLLGVQNDVQMAVCLLLCLGDKYIHLIDQQLLQQWFLSYVGMQRLHTNIYNKFCSVSHLFVVALLYKKLSCCCDSRSYCL